MADTAPSWADSVILPNSREITRIEAGGLAEAEWRDFLDGIKAAVRRGQVAVDVRVTWCCSG
jgi:hypothetical protein